MTILNDVALFIGWCILGPIIVAVACYFLATIVAVIRAFRGP